MKWFVAVAAVFLLGGALVGARRVAMRDAKSAGRYPAPEVAVGAQRVVLPWEIAMRDPEVREKLEAKPKARRRKKKAPAVVTTSPKDQEVGKAVPEDKPEEAPNWKDWAPG